ncbi:hypothetical protein N7474_007066 [Penicillium riverlandense]|uniref:uncharacterized protein n=1 Tax=Penicillium riverlandense TaxID=1903569 RepID=UPI0025474F67|nr:uncharacterized protein N7474_007066 [Penicillium riverlandense]KAJ5815289.1 hypothetical protein N7474_007066 [Penicillium riverlandense]
MTSRKRSSGDDLVEDNSHKKAKVSHRDTSKVDSNGDRYWEISKMRRVTVSSFRGKTLVNVREYYEKDGQELPGKKGISMPVDQFAALVTLLPEIEQSLTQQGQSLPRPNYSGDGDGNRGDSEDMEQDNLKPDKQNIEATSDEDSEA